MIEIWEEIKCYEGYYQVSNFGRIMAMQRVVNSKNNSTSIKKQKLRKVTTLNSGYCNIVLSKDNKDKCKLVHRLVAEAFISNPYSKSEVNHINGIKTDNRAVNLEWVTSSENQYHAFNNNLQISRKGEQCKCSKLSEPNVVEIVNSYFNGESKKSLTTRFNIHINTINRLISGRSWKHITKPLIDRGLAVDKKTIQQ